MNNIMCQRGNIFDFALITSSAEAGTYFVTFILILCITLPTPEIFTNNDVVSAYLISCLVIIFLTLTFTGLEIFGIIERNKCPIVAGLIFRAVRFLLMDLGGIISM